MGLPAMAEDIKNAYGQAPTSTKRAIYDSRDVGRDPRLHLRYCMARIAVQLSKSNQDVLFRPAVERDGFEYTEYALLYVDIVLVISGNAEQ
eukprot:scaffold4761_cov105-Skeletonema_dohrnii-CCMP3373.AAC.1